MASGCAPNLNYNTYTADGVQTCYLITFDYHDDEDIRARLDGVELDNTTYRITPGQPSEVCFDTPPSGELTIYRCTDLDALSANFYAGSTVRAVDLNDNFEQLLYGVQDANNRILTQSEAVTVDLGFQDDGPENPGQITNTRGTNATIPIVNTTRAGIMAGSMFDKLDAINVDGSGQAVTNLSEGTRTTTTVDVDSSTGTNATLSPASSSLAGVMSAADKTKLDGLNTDAENAGIYLSRVNDDTAAGNITFEQNIIVDGKVAIGTAPSDFKLDVAGTAAVNDSLTVSRDNSAPGIVLNNSNYAGGDASIAYFDTGAVVFKADATEIFRYAADGNVGIGTNSPGAKLEISGDANTGLRIRDTNGSYSQFVYNDNGSSLSSLVIGVDPTNESTAPSDIQFKVDGSEKMRVNSSGHVGIGTGSPDSPLHVQGSRNYTGTTPGLDSYDINFRSGSAVVSIGQSDGIPSIQGHGSGTGYNLSLAPNAGNVGIGTTTPAQKLSVLGTSNDTINETTGTAVFRGFGDC